jgi:hypothetical protein
MGVRAQSTAPSPGGMPLTLRVQGASIAAPQPPRPQGHRKAPFSSIQASFPPPPPTHTLHTSSPPPLPPAQTYTPIPRAPHPLDHAPLLAARRPAPTRVPVSEASPARAPALTADALPPPEAGTGAGVGAGVGGRGGVVGGACPDAGRPVPRISTAVSAGTPLPRGLSRGVDGSVGSRGVPGTGPGWDPHPAGWRRDVVSGAVNDRRTKARRLASSWALRATSCRRTSVSSQQACASTCGRPSRC